MDRRKDPVLPTFLTVGVAKSGTTSLFHYLNQHPEIFIPNIKETFFFIASIYRDLDPGDPHSKNIAQRTINTFEEYLSVFKNVTHEKGIGEIGTFYGYYYEKTIPEIKKYLGDIKIIFIIRNPVDRAYSAYTHFCRYGLEKYTFEKALDQEKVRKENNWYTMWYYTDVGFYCAPIKAFMDHFSQVKVCLYDDLKNNTVNLMKDLYQFLEVDCRYIPDTAMKHMVSGVPKHQWIHSLLVRPNSLKRLLKPLLNIALTDEKKYKIIEKINQSNMIKPLMQKETRDYLKDLYREEISKLEDLIGRDLTSWIN